MIGGGGVAVRAVRTVLGKSGGMPTTPGFFTLSSASRGFDV